jgi:hypothetical protein
MLLSWWMKRLAVDPYLRFYQEQLRSPTVAPPGSFVAKKGFLN